MATTTHTAPIGIDNINSSFYVHGAGYGFPSIQAAVDYVRTSPGTGGVGEIIIAHGYGYTEDINNITGGQYSIPIKDLRDGNYITYEWDGTHYIPKDFVQYAAIVAQSKIVSGGLPGSTAMEYDPINPGVNGHGQINVLAKPGLGMPFMSLVLTPQDGVTPAHALLQGTAIADGTIVCQFPEKVIIAPPDTLGTGTATAWIGQAESRAGKGMSLTANPADNDIVFQGQTAGAAFDQAISLNPQGGDVLINGVPIKPATLATYPPTGIPQSTGSAWGASIDPATLQGKLSLTTTGTNGPSTLTGNVLNIPQYAGTGSGMIYPGAGIGVSTGSAWGASIDPATLQGKLTLTTTGTNGPSTLAGNALNIPQYTAPAQVYPGAGIPQSTGSAWGASIDPADVPRLSTANTFTQPQTIGGLIKANAGISTSGTTAASASRLNLQTSGGTASIEMCGTDAVTLSQIYFRIQHSDGSGKVDALSLGSGGAGFPASLYAADAHFTSLAVSGEKSFVVPHPLDETKDIWHSCLEGPENGVFYRGEVVTANGTAEVTLPDYFEALTYPEDRSVQLTQVFEDGAVLTMLAASRVVDGKFTVQSSAPIATVAWEVKAVRRIGVERLQVTQIKREAPPAPEPEPIAATPKAKEKKRA